MKNNSQITIKVSIPNKVLDALHMIESNLKIVNEFLSSTDIAKYNIDIKYK